MGETPKRECCECGKEFLPKCSHQKRCSECIQKAKKQRAKNAVKYHCKICGRYSKRLNQFGLCSFCKRPKPEKPKHNPYRYCKRCGTKIYQRTFEKYEGYCHACFDLIKYFEKMEGEETCSMKV